MSLNRNERDVTARELADNLALTGLSQEQVRERTGLPPERFQSALDVSAVMDPADVWLVRDTIEDAVREAGRTPLPYSRLTDGMRRAAAMWFGYRRWRPARVGREAVGAPAGRGCGRGSAGPPGPAGPGLARSHRPRSGNRPEDQKNRVVRVTRAPLAGDNGSTGPAGP